MKLSVIITVYNEEKYIEKCLTSLVEQSLQDSEIIVVDDGSNDNSKLKTQNVKLQLKIKNLRIITQEHQGLAAARNLGAKEARGDILVFLDGDMYFEKNFLRDLIKPIVLGQTKGTFSTEEYIANWDNVWSRCWNYNWNLKDKRRVDPKRGDQRREFRAILKKEYFKAGGLNSLGYTDAWSLSQKLGYQPTVTTAKYYHFNPGSLKEVFFQARWVAKRDYKFGRIGKLLAFIRANPIFSLINGFRKSMTHKEPAFILFKLVYDCGTLLGLIENRKYA